MNIFYVFSKSNEWLTECYTDKNATYNSFRITGIAKVPLFNLLATLYEFDLMNNWMPVVKECKEYSKMSLICKTGMVKVGLWAPFNLLFADRQCNMYAFGVDDMDKNNRLICYFDSNNNHKLVTFPELNKGTKRVDLTNGGFYFEKIDNNTTKLIATWNIDIHMKLPVKLLNWASGHVASWLLGGMVKASKFDENSEYYKRIQNDTEFYGMVMDKLGKVQLNNNDSNNNNNNNNDNNNDIKNDENVESKTNENIPVNGDEMDNNGNQNMGHNHENNENMDGNDDDNVNMNDNNENGTK